MYKGVELLECKACIDHIHMCLSIPPKYFEIIFYVDDMHELSIAQSMLEIVEQESASFNKAKVTAIRLRIGKLSGVVPDALRFAFEIISKGSIAEDASLDIEEVPISIKCNVCRKVFVAEDPFMICPHCDGFNVEMVSGKELEIKELEIDDGEDA